MNHFQSLEYPIYLPQLPTKKLISFYKSVIHDSRIITQYKTHKVMPESHICPCEIQRRQIRTCLLNLFERLKQFVQRLRESLHTTFPQIIRAVKYSPIPYHICFVFSTLSWICKNAGWMGILILKSSPNLLLR